MDQNSGWSTLISAAGAIGASAGLVYAAGYAVLSLRYMGFGVSGHSALGATAREQAILRGGVAMLLWTLLGLGLALIVTLLGRLDAGKVSRPVWRRTPPSVGWVVIGAAIAIAALSFVVHVIWPLAAIAAAAVFVVAARRLSDHPVTHFLVCAVAVAVVALAYESDRLTFLVQIIRVELKDTAQGVDGILLAQTDRGIYVGVIGNPSKLVFVPADQVERATTWQGAQRVVPGAAHDRRKLAISRLVDLELR